MKYLLTFSRLFVGILFIISGLIKANDALGFSYKLEEYFEVFGTHFLIPYALWLAMFVCILEIVLGVATLFGFMMRLTTWALLLLIVFFTFLTFYSAYFNKVTDCGCFGDALHLTPWQSFGKDILFLIFILPLFFARKKIKPLFSKQVALIAVTLGLIVSTWFTVHAYNHLPFIDFRPYAVGKNIPKQMELPAGAQPDVYETTFVYKNNKTGELKEFQQDNYPWQDTLTWTWVKTNTRLVKAGDKPAITDFSITTKDGFDYTNDIINNPEYNFLLICYDLNKTNKEAFKKINPLAEAAVKKGYQFYALTASINQIDAFRHDVQAMFDFYITDATVLKTMIRSNPGLMLLKAGTVVDMWHYNDLPDYQALQKKYQLK